MIIHVSSAILIPLPLFLLILSQNINQNIICNFLYFLYFFYFLLLFSLWSEYWVIWKRLNGKKLLETNYPPSAKWENLSKFCVQFGPRGQSNYCSVVLPLHARLLEGFDRASKSVWFPLRLFVSLVCLWVVLKYWCLGQGNNWKGMTIFCFFFF